MRSHNLTQSLLIAEMKKFTILILFALFVHLIHASSEEEDENEISSASLYGKLYCQTDYVIKRNLILLESKENLYTMFVNNANQLNCDKILNQSSEEIYKELDTQMKKFNFVYTAERRQCTLSKMKVN